MAIRQKEKMAHLLTEELKRNRTSKKGSKNSYGRTKSNENLKKFIKQTKNAKRKQENWGGKIRSSKRGNTDNRKGEKRKKPQEKQ